MSKDEWNRLYDLLKVALKPGENWAYVSGPMGEDESFLLVRHKK